MAIMDSVKRLMKGRSERVERGIDTAVGHLGRYSDSLARRAEAVKARARTLDADRAGAPGGPSGTAPTTATPGTPTGLPTTTPGSPTAPTTTTPGSPTAPTTATPGSPTAPTTATPGSPTAPTTATPGTSSELPTTTTSPSAEPAPPEPLETEEAPLRGDLIRDDPETPPIH